uniref:Uncharacterized protein n=1 Tax=Phlebotomus papatasi TaxID=29031 RepID=A0A1B0DGY4_PHLPP
MQSLMKSRGGLVGTITKIEGFIQVCQDDLSLTTKQALMSQLEILKSVRGKYQEIQQQIIDKQESDSRKQNEHDGMVDILSKCSLLEQQLEKLLLEAQDSGSQR